ncbi:MAG TPA: hypothetical protein VF474_04450, partial [Phenylobacterium sp.]
MQDRFSWKGVAISAISAGLTGGAELKFGAASGFVEGAVRGAAINAATQGIAVATGLQKRFDWAGVAVAGVASGVISGLGSVLPGAGAPALSRAGLANSALSGAAGAVAGAATRSLLTGTNFGDNILAALPDVIGATAGNAIGGAILQRQEQVAHDRATAARHANGDYLTESLQGAAARYVADHPIRLDALNGLADTRASIDALLTGNFVTQASGVGALAGGSGADSLSALQLGVDAANKSANRITEAQLKKIFPQARSTSVTAFVDPINSAFQKFGLDSVYEQAAFLGQAAIENPTLGAREEPYYRTFNTANAAHPTLFP